MKNKDQNLISDLLSKLQAAYSAPSQKESHKPKKKKADTVDLELEDKLREVLSEVTPTPPKKGKASTSTKKERQESESTPKAEQSTPIDKPIESPKPERVELAEDLPPVEETPEPSFTVTSEPTKEAIPTNKEKKAKKTLSPRSKKKEPTKTEEVSSIPTEKIKEDQDFPTKKEINDQKDTSSPTSDIDIQEKENIITTFALPTEGENDLSDEEPDSQEPLTEQVEPIVPTPKKPKRTSSPKKEPKRSIVSTTIVEKEGKSKESSTTEGPSGIFLQAENRTRIEEHKEIASPPVKKNDLEQAASPKPDLPMHEETPKKSVPRTAEPIRIVPKAPNVSSTATSPIKGTTAQAESVPIVIRPREENIEAPAQGSKSSDSIVIRPAVSRQDSRDAIVIRPRTDTPAPSPTPIEPEQISNEPIRIGKKVDIDMNNNTQKTKQTQATSPKSAQATKDPTVTMIPHDTRFEADYTPTAVSPKKEKDVTMVPQDDRFAANKEPQAQDKPISRRATASKSSAEAAKRTTKQNDEEYHKALISASPFAQKVVAEPRHTAKKKDAYEPIPALSELDESLDEVLDEIAPQDFPADEENQQTEASVETPDHSTVSEGTHSEQASALYAEVRERSGLTEDDIAMMFELGYENEIGRVVGYENLKKLKYEHLRLTSKTHRKHYRTAFGYRGEEYGGTEDREKVLAAYHKDRTHLILRAVATALLTVLLFFIDMPWIIGQRFVDLLSFHPVISPILELLLLILCAIPSLRQLNAGIRQFYKFAPTPYSVCAIVLPFAIVYDLIAIFLHDLPSFGSVFALSLLVTVICDSLRMNGELRSFRILSGEGKKYVLESVPGRKKKLRQGEKIVKIISDDVGESFYRIRTAEQTVGFFRRFNAMESAAKPFMILLLTMLTAATISAFVIAIWTLSLTAAIKAFMTVLLVCAPVSAIFSYFYPLFHANRLLSHSNCTIVGEEGAEELESQKTVIYNDTDLLIAKKHTETILREDYDLSRDRRLVECVFQKLGGTLGQLTTNVAKVYKDMPVSIVRVTDGGVEAMVENAYHVLLGKEAFMRRNGIKVPKESTDRELRRTPDVSLMYIAIDGVLKLSYEIKYITKPEFENQISEFAFYNTTVGLHTYDPNLSEEFLNGMRQNDEEPIRVIRPGRFEEKQYTEVLDTSAVSLASPENMTSILYTATGIGTARRFGLRIQLIASIVGTLAALLLTFLQQNELLGVLPIAIYQLFWMVVSFIATHSELNRSTLHLDR